MYVYTYMYIYAYIYMYKYILTYQNTGISNYLKFFNYKLTRNAFPGLFERVDLSCKYFITFFYWHLSILYETSVRCFQLWNHENVHF